MPKAVARTTQLPTLPPRPFAELAPGEWGGGGMVGASSRLHLLSIWEQVIYQRASPISKGRTPRTLAQLPIQSQGAAEKPCASMHANKQTRTIDGTQHTW